ncbi:MAG: hypothetical protein J6K32_12880 [Clostridia bacterium]|nr:hypothetical protein [Clostridia bacterium]
MSCCRMCKYSGRYDAGNEKSVCWLNKGEPRVVDAGGRVCSAYCISAQAYLEDVTNLQRRIAIKTETAHRYHDMAMRATSSMSAARSSGTGTRSKVATNMDKYIDIERAIERDAERLKNKITITMEMIDGVNAPERKELLELRYLCGLTWEKVGQRMRYDKRQSQRIHKRALEDVQRQMDERGITS